MFLINHLSSTTLQFKTPFFKLFGTNSDYNTLRSFGCRYFPYLKSQGVNKFAKKTYPCIFIGYSPMNKGYRCLNPTTNRVYFSRHVVFYESNFPFNKNSSSTIISAPELATYYESEAWIQKGEEEMEKNTTP